MTDIMFEIPSNTNIEKCIITKQTVLEKKDPELVINEFREDGDYSIFITGSNSYLLSGELVTKLTGRYLEFEMYPLTFDEYLGMKSFLNIKVDTPSKKSC